MRIIPRQWLLIGLAILANTGAAQGEDLKSCPSSMAATSTLAVDAMTPTAELRCTAASAQRAREIAEQAWQDGSYQLAGECYLAAGEPAMADRAFLKAVAPLAAVTSQRVAENGDQVKAQLRQWKQALRSLQRTH
jgi:hypothetical protein